MEPVKNACELSGCVLSEPEFSHSIYGKTFLVFDLEVQRESGNTDILRCMILEENAACIYDGETVNIRGQIRTYNRPCEQGSRLEVVVFIHEIVFDDTPAYMNECFLDGYVCKKPNFRITPLGREICDMLIAVNRPYNKSDYIPVIFWGRNAKKACALCVGDNIELKGRLQSRTYEKRQANGSIEVRLTHELSCSEFRIIT